MNNIIYIFLNVSVMFIDQDLCICGPILESV